MKRSHLLQELKPFFLRWLEQGADAGLTVGEGPGIDLVGATVGLGGDLPLVLHADGSPASEYATAAAACAAATSGERVQLQAGVYLEDLTVPAGVVLAGRGPATVIAGQVTLEDGAAIVHCDVLRDEDTLDDVVCIVPPDGDGEMAYVWGCELVAHNATGNGYCVYGDCDHVAVLRTRTSAQSAGVKSCEWGGAAGGWPSEVYVATVSGGVYHTTDMSGPDDAGQPTWTEVNDGLLSTAMQSLCLDATDPAGRQYCLDTSGNVYTRTTGAWSVLLTAADARTLTGESYGMVYSLCVDPVTGYLYGLFSNDGSNYAYPYCVRSVDQGTNWTAALIATENYGNNARRVGNIDAYNGVVVASRQQWVYSNYVYHSSDHGQTWGFIRDGGGTLYRNWVRLHPADTSGVYQNRYPDAYDLRWNDLTTGAGTLLQDALNIGPGTGGAMWCDPADADHVYLLCAGKLYETTDAFATLEDASPATIDAQLAELCEGTDEGYWILGRIYGTNCIMVSTDGVTAVGKAGANNASSPYTDSIPDTCGGICERGIQVVGYSAQSATPYVLGCEIPSAAGRTAAIPLYGDRASWRTDYASGATHADDWAAGDSHHAEVTLGEGSDPALSLEDQVLTLADVLTPAEHAAIDHSGYDATAIHEDEAGEIHAITEKETPEDNDEILLEDSGSGYVKKRVKISSLPAGSGGSGTLANAGYQETVGDGVNTEYTVTHSLGTWDVLVQVYDLGVTPREKVDPEIETVSADAVVVTFESAPSADQYRVLVVAADVSAVSDAADLTYTPTTLTDWDSDTDPGDAGDALDQLAERVDDLEGGALADHDHSGDAGDGGTFDAANLTSGAATDGQVLTADGAGGAAWEDAAAGGASDAADVTYTPTTLTDWDSDTDPGDVDNALDQLAERVDDLEAIPGGTDANAIHDNVAGEIAAVTEKASPVSADLILLEDSADGYAKKYAEIGNLPGGGGGGDSTYTDAYASRPAASNDGDLFLPSDGAVIERDTGAAWVPWGPLFPLAGVADAPGTWVNQGAASVETTYGGIYLEAPANSRMSMRIRAKAAPSTPYTITIAVLPLLWPANYDFIHLGWRQSSDGKLVHIRFGYVSDWRLSVIKSNSPTSDSATYVDYVWRRDCPLFLRIADDGTDRICSYSADGQHWMTLHTVGRTDFLTPDQVFWGVDTRVATQKAGCTLLSWEEG